MLIAKRYVILSAAVLPLSIIAARSKAVPAPGVQRRIVHSWHTYGISHEGTYPLWTVIPLSKFSGINLPRFEVSFIASAKRSSIQCHVHVPVFSRYTHYYKCWESISHTQAKVVPFQQKVIGNTIFRPVKKEAAALLSGQRPFCFSYFNLPRIGASFYLIGTLFTAKRCHMNKSALLTFLRVLH